MATNLALDNDLLQSALIIGGYKTKRETVNQALKEFIQRRRTSELIGMFGTVTFDEAFDYKATRSKRAAES
jgi:Arc/MetJ family transcription regulator